MNHVGASVARIHSRFTFVRTSLLVCVHTRDVPFSRLFSSRMYVPYACKISLPPLSPWSGPRGKRRQMSSVSSSSSSSSFSSVLFSTASYSRPRVRSKLAHKGARCDSRRLSSQKEIISDRSLSHRFSRVVGAPLLRILLPPPPLPLPPTTLR